MSYFLKSTALIFFVIFNLGYVFHDVIFGEWLHEMEKEIAREEFIIPLIALAFAIYAAILSHIYPIYRKAHENKSGVFVAIKFGIIMGILFDALQGGLIEVATFKIPVEVFFLDSSYHVFIEGVIGGLLANFAYERWNTKIVE